MKRITLTAAAARLVEQQVSAHMDQRDEKGKPIQTPQDRRKWDRIADAFTDAAGEHDAEIERLQKDGMAFGSLVLSEQSREVDYLMSIWDKKGPEPDNVSAAVLGVKDLFQMRISAKERELTDAMTVAEDTLGLAVAEVDIDDAQVDWLKTIWDALDLNSGRRVRRLINLVTDALKNAVELVKDGDRYVPKGQETGRKVIHINETAAHLLAADAMENGKSHARELADALTDSRVEVG